MQVSKKNQTSVCKKYTFCCYLEMEIVFHFLLVNGRVIKLTFKTSLPKYSWGVLYILLSGNTLLKAFNSPNSSLFANFHPDM